MGERDPRRSARWKKPRHVPGASRHPGADRCLAGEQRETFDLIFVDPRHSGVAGTVLAELARHLESGGQAYIEQAAPVVAPPGLTVRRSGRAGRSHFALLVKE